MKKNKVCLVLLLLCVTNNVIAQHLPKLEWIAKTGAKKFPSSKKIFSVNDYGAVSDTVTVNSLFIQKAIDDCAAKGGGVVTFKPGTYVTGSIFLKSNVHLKIDKGVLIL